MTARSRAVWMGARLVVFGLLAVGLAGTVVAQAPPPPQGKWVWYANGNDRCKLVDSGKKTPDGRRIYNVTGVKGNMELEQGWKVTACEFRYYVSISGFPSAYPQNPSGAMKATIGNLQPLPPTVNKFYQTLTGDATAVSVTEPDTIVVAVKLQLDNNPQSDWVVFDPPALPTPPDAAPPGGGD